MLDIPTSASPQVVSLGTFLTKQESTAPGSSKHKTQRFISRKRKIPPVSWLLLSPQRPFAFVGSPFLPRQPPQGELAAAAGLGPSRGARGALPVADTATRASGSGRYFPRSAVDEGKYRAPQQDRRPLRVGGGKMRGKRDGLLPRGESFQLQVREG